MRLGRPEIPVAPKTFRHAEHGKGPASMFQVGAGVRVKARLAQGRARTVRIIHAFFRHGQNKRVADSNLVWRQCIRRHQWGFSHAWNGNRNNKKENQFTIRPHHP